MLNWDHIRVFLAVADKGTVSAAARALGVSHATVLRAVAKLEHQLQCRLFDHHQTGYRITARGRAIYANASDMAVHADLLTRAARGTDPLPAGTLRLAAPDPTMFPVMPLIQQFGSAYPGVQIQIVPDAVDADGRVADVMIRVTNSPPEAMVGRQLTRLVLTCFAPSKPAPNQRWDWIVWAGPDDSQEQQVRWLRQLADESAVALEADSHGQALDAVRAGIGAALLVASEHTRMLEPFEPKRRPAHSGYGVWILTHPDLRGSHRISAFMQFLADRFHDRPDSS